MVIGDWQRGRHEELAAKVHEPRTGRHSIAIALLTYFASICHNGRA
jgi:hypothetical protein